MGEWFACSKRFPRMHFDGRMYFSGADVFWKSEGIGRGSTFYHAQPLKFKLQLQRKTVFLGSTGGDAVFRNYRPGWFCNWICYSETRPKRSAPFQRVQPERSCGDLIVVSSLSTNEPNDNTSTGLKHTRARHGTLLSRRRRCLCRRCRSYSSCRTAVPRQLAKNVFSAPHPPEKKKRF